MNQATIALGMCGALALGTIALVQCAQPTSNSNVSAIAQAAPSAPVHESTLAELLAAASSKEEAFNICRPYMGNVSQGDVSVGAACFAAWASYHLSYRDMNVSHDETKPGLVMKNAAKELGLRICATGTLIELYDKTTPVGTLTEGELYSYSGNIYHFINVGGSGSLERLNEAHMCGVVVGTFTYSNSQGGTTHTIDLVGAFGINNPPPADVVNSDAMNNAYKILVTNAQNSPPVHQEVTPDLYSDRK